MGELELDYERFTKALGARIKKFRLEQGLSLRDMVVKHDYHDSQWRRFERSGPGNLNSLLRIARALNTSVSMLLDGLGEYASPALAKAHKNASEGEGTSEAGEKSQIERRSGVERRKTADRRTP